MERFELQDGCESPDTPQLLSHNVSGDFRSQREWKSHGERRKYTRGRVARNGITTDTYDSPAGMVLD